MSYMERRLREMNLEILSLKEIGGAHAGNIYRVEAMGESDGERTRYIYKEFAQGRNKEVDIHMNIADVLRPFNRVVDIWEDSPQAMFMLDLGETLKIGFESRQMEEKRRFIEEVLKRLASLHETSSVQAASKLPVHRLSSEWRDWCLEQLMKLCKRKPWARSEWIKVIEEAYEQLGIPHYQWKCPAVITHGDPHLENVFHIDEEVWLIDWEWAAIGSPLRDVTILMQDLYDDELISFVPECYRKYVKERGIDLQDDDFWSDFNYLYIDHLAMMLGWEVEKYFQGYLSEEGILRIIEWKIGEIGRVKKM